jgi:hypothetical protein
LWRTLGAARALAAQPARRRVTFIGQVGFVLISLFDGFAIVTALDLHLGPVVVALSAVVGVAVVGVFAIRTATKREQAGPLGQNSVDLAS